LTIESADFSNKNIRPYFGLSEQAYGIVTIDSKRFFSLCFFLNFLVFLHSKLIVVLEFMYFFGIVFVVSTTLVLLFKREINQDNPDEEEFTVKETYLQMWKIVWLAPIKKLALILLTIKVSAIIIIGSIEFLKKI
jgi:hypothetical protein